MRDPHKRQMTLRALGLVLGVSTVLIISMSAALGEEPTKPDAPLRPEASPPTVDVPDETATELVVPAPDDVPAPPSKPLRETTKPAFEPTPAPDASPSKSAEEKELDDWAQQVLEEGGGDAEDVSDPANVDGVSSFSVIFAGTLILAGFALFFVQRARKANGGQGQTMRHVQSLRLGNRQQVTLVEVYGRVLVLGVTSGRIDLITEIDISEMSPSAGESEVSWDGVFDAEDGGAEVENGEEPADASVSAYERLAAQAKASSAFRDSGGWSELSDKDKKTNDLLTEEARSLSERIAKMRGRAQSRRSK